MKEKKEREGVSTWFLLWCRREKVLVFILALALLLRLFQLSRSPELWWDSYVYIAMSKYLFSGGVAGFWEVFRAVLWPLFLGIFWWLGLPILPVAQFFDLLFSLASVFLVYLIGLRLGDKRSALLAAFIFGTVPLFIQYVGLALTEAFAMFLGLLGVYLFVLGLEKEEKKSRDWSSRRRYFALSGVFFGLAFLAKFPQGLLLAAALSVLALRDFGPSWRTWKHWKEKVFACFEVGIPFVFVTAPFFILSYHFYGHPLEALRTGSWIVGTGLWLYETSWLFYMKDFFLRYFVFLFFYPALFYFFWNGGWKVRTAKKQGRFFLFFMVLISLAYFSFAVARKEYRYMTFLLPFLSLICAQYILVLYQHFSAQKKPLLRAFSFLAVVLAAILFSQVQIYDSILSEEGAGFGHGENFAYFVEYIQGFEDDLPLIASNPSIVVFVDNPLYPTGDISLAPGVYEWKKEDYEFIFLDSCDFSCPEGDLSCLSEIEAFFSLVAEENTLVQRERVVKQTFEKGEFVKGAEQSCTLSLFQKI